MAITAGSTLGPYEIERQIGSGGMATVYIAHQPKLDRHVAIKMMHQNFAQEAQFLSRFEREARIVARLDHPNIVPVYDYDTHDGQPYLVMKHIDGVTLKTLLRKTALDSEDVLQILEPVADALTYAHAQGVLHRDVKPSNIIIDQDGRAYLTDFGLARIARQGESTMSVDTMLGTPHYISPEQAQGQANLDARTDVYSLGVVLYELTTGRVPFMGDTSVAIVHDHIYTPPPPPREIRPEIPEAVEDVLLRALAKDPADRYPTPNALIRAYAGAIAGEQPSVPPRTARRMPQPPRPPSQPHIPSPIAGEDDFDQVRQNLRAAGQEIKAAFKQAVRGSSARRMIPRPGASWRNEGPEGAGFYTDEEIESFDDSLPLEERVRRRVARKLKARGELVKMVATFASVSLMLWVIWLMTDPGGFMWPVFPMLGFMIALVVKTVEYHQQHGGGYERQQRTIQRELERERERLGYDEYAAKAKNEDVPREIRLSEDGELTESFIEELEDDQDARRRR